MLKKFRILLYSLTVFLGCIMGNAKVCAQGTGGGDIPTVSFFSDNAQMEDDRNEQNYTITIYSPDGEWKLQLSYNSDHMFGTFGNEEFDLAGKGKSFNFARNPQNSMIFYSFTDMMVSVADEGTCYRVKADCKASDKIRFDVEATIDVPQAEDTISVDLGYARVEPNAFMGTYNIHAENDDYKLTYGVVGTELVGTFYRSDILLPVLVDKNSNEEITPLSAMAVHTQEDGVTYMSLDIIGDDKVLYHLTMNDGSYELDVKQEVTVVMNNSVLQDLTEMYGCYQFAAQNAEYGIGVALTLDAMLSGGERPLTKNDFVLPYTAVMHVADETTEEIFDINGSLDFSGASLKLMVDIMCMNGTLYHVTMTEGNGTFSPDSVIDIDFGHVAVLDYSKGLGVVGLGGVLAEKYQIRAYFQAYQLDGDISADKFFMDLCDVMVVEGETLVFHDAQSVTAHMEKNEGRTDITIEMLGIDNIMYRAHMYLDELNCMKDGEYTFDDDGVTMMLAIQEGSDGQNSDYWMQIQHNTDNIYNERDEMVGEGYIFSYYFSQKENTLSGDYGYAAGTLAPEPHYFFEHGCEVRVAPLAGQLHIRPVRAVTLEFNFQIYTTWIYDLVFSCVGENNVKYTASGRNYLLCVGQDDEMVEMDESHFDGIVEQLAKQGLKVRKILKGGKILIEKDGTQYNAFGNKIE